MKHRLAALAMLVALSGNGPATAGTPAANDAGDGRLTPQARGELTGRFVRKWAAHVQRVYDVPVGVWARRMVPTFVAADPDNFRNALKRATFEGAMAELTGTGHRLSDDRAMRRLSAAACSSTYARELVTPGSTFIVPIPGRPIGYVMTAAACNSSNLDDTVDWTKRGFNISLSGAGLPLSTALCSGKNAGAFLTAIEGAAQCCRIPGR